MKDMQRLQRGYWECKGAMPCDECVQLERGEARVAEVGVMVECWKRLQYVNLVDDEQAVDEVIVMANRNSDL